MKVGVIRCLQTEDMCPGTTDFKVIRGKKGAFAGVEGEIEIIGFNTCGGCPGKKLSPGQRKWSSVAPTPSLWHPVLLKEIRLVQMSPC